MAFQATPDCIEVAMRATQDGQPVVNIFHIQTAGGVTDLNLQDAGDKVNDWWQGNMQALLNNTYVLHEIVATDISVESGHQYTRTLTTDNAGAVTGASLPSNAAAVISWRTANIGRSFRGRTYIGGLGAATLASPTSLDSTFAGNLAAAGVQLIEYLDTVSMVLCVLSRFAGGVLRVTGLLTQIIQVIVDTKVDTQRRRTAN